MKTIRNGSECFVVIDDVRYPITLEQFTKIEIGHGVEIQDGEVIITDTQESNQHYFNIGLKGINNRFSEKVKRLKSLYSDEEIQSWEIQFSEAQRVKSGATDTLLKSILLPGETEEELADKIINNSEQYFSIYAPALQEKRIALKELEETYSI